MASGSANARALLLAAAGGLGPVTQVSPLRGAPANSTPVSIQHTADSSIFTAADTIRLNAPTVIAPGVTFTATQGVTFANGVTATGTSAFGTVTAGAVVAGALAVDSLGAATPGRAVVDVNAGLTVHGDFRVLGSVDTVGTRNLTVVDKVVTLGAVDADEDGVPDADDGTRDGAGIVVAGAPRYLPATKAAAAYEKSVRWERQEGDFLAGGVQTAPHRKPLWKVRGGGLSVAGPDHVDREAQFFFAPRYDAGTASLGLYYAVDDGRTRLVHTFATAPFGSAAPTWKTRASLVAAQGETRDRSIVAFRAATYAVVGGALPPGTALSPAGLLSGAATTLGDSAFTVRATSADGSAVSDQGFAFRVLPPAQYYPGLAAPRWTTRGAALRPVPVGAGLAVQMDAGDPYAGSSYNDDITYSVVAGALPEGVSLSPGGLLATTGFVRMAGTFTFTARAYSEASHLLTDKVYSLRVVPRPESSAVLDSDALLAVGPASVTVHVPDALSAANLYDAYAYVRVSPADRADTYWPLAGIDATPDTLTVRFAGPEAMSYRPGEGPAPAPAATAVSAALGAPVSFAFFRFTGIGELRVPFDLGDMNTFDPKSSVTLLNGARWSAETSFTSAAGSPGSACNGGFARSAAAPGNWTVRGMFNDYIGPTSTLYFIPGDPTLRTMSGEFLDIRSPFDLAVSGYSFDPTVSDVPSSWAFMGLTAVGAWQLLDDHVDVQQPLSETDYGGHVSDVAADRVYSLANTTAYAGYLFVVRSTTGLVGNTAMISGFSLVVNGVTGI